MNRARPQPPASKPKARTRATSQSAVPGGVSPPELESIFKTSLAKALFLFVWRGLQPSPTHWPELSSADRVPFPPRSEGKSDKKKQKSSKGEKREKGQKREKKEKKADKAHKKAAAPAMQIENTPAARALRESKDSEVHSSQARLTVSSQEVEGAHWSAKLKPTTGRK